MSEKKYPNRLEQVQIIHESISEGVTYRSSLVNVVSNSTEQVLGQRVDVARKLYVDKSSGQLLPSGTCGHADLVTILAHSKAVAEFLSKLPIS